MFGTNLHGLYDGELKKLNNDDTVEPVLACHVRAILANGNPTRPIYAFERNFLRESFGLRAVQQRNLFEPLPRGAAIN